MGILIRGGRVVDAAAQIDKIADVYLDDGVIQKWERSWKQRIKMTRLQTLKGWW